jgi:hypothetical protein
MYGTRPLYEPRPGTVSAMSDLTIADLTGPSKQLAEELVRVLLADEPTGQEPLMGILEYALQALVTNNVHPVLVPGQEVRWTSG